jgi:hypothetical protein
MTAEQQSLVEGSLHAEQDGHQETIPQKRAQRTVTLAQFRLAKFICEKEVAEFGEVVGAIEKCDHEKVDAWKAEAQQKGPRIREWSFPKFTWTGFGGSTEETDNSSEGRGLQASGT